MGRSERDLFMIVQEGKNRSGNAWVLFKISICIKLTNRQSHMANPRDKGGIEYPIQRGRALQNYMEKGMDREGWTIGDNNTINLPGMLNDSMDNLYSSS